MTHIKVRRQRMRTKDVDYIFERIEESEIGCWLWTGTINNEGYGAATSKDAETGRVTHTAHRIAYELLNSPIPAGKELDHLCRVRRCVNPTHLEPVTHRENMMRSPIAASAKNALKTHCPSGHLYSPENTYIRKGKGFTMRMCRTCMKSRYTPVSARSKVA